MQTELRRAANRTMGAGLAYLDRRAVGAAAVIGLLGALLSGSLAVAVAPLVVVVLVHALCYQPVERLFVVTVGATLLLVHPSEVPFMGRWTSPLEPLEELWFEPVSTSIPGVPIPFAPELLMALWVLARAVTSPGPALDPARRLYLRLSVLATGALMMAEVYGIARRGDARQSFHQLSPLLMTIALGATACLLASPALLRTLERLLLVAAGLRAVLAIAVYLTVFRPVGGSYLYVTSHSDSVLWVVALALLGGRVVTTFRLEPQRARLALMVLVAVAVIVNNRRLAFVELGLAGAYAVWAMPTRLHRLRKRVAIGVAPLLVVYVLAGLSAPPSRFFMPVQSLNSVNDKENASTESRHIEDSNLMVTIREGGPFGLGFGHEYTEAIKGPDISKAFPQYRYLPHNSTLGLLAFAGIVGFVGFWLPFVAGMGAVVRLRRHPDHRLQAAGIWFAAAIIAHSIMAWGDIGLQSSLNGLIGALGAGLASGLVGRRYADTAAEPTVAAPAAPTVEVLTR